MRTKNKPKARKHLPWFVFRIAKNSPKTTVASTCFYQARKFDDSRWSTPLRHGQLGLGADGMPLVGHQTLMPSDLMSFQSSQCPLPFHRFESMSSKVKPTPLPSNSETDEFKRQVPPMATFGLCPAKLCMLHLKYLEIPSTIHCENM